MSEAIKDSMQIFTEIIPFKNYFIRASKNDISCDCLIRLERLRLEDGTKRFMKIVFGKWGVLLNGQKVCRNLEQIEDSLNKCGVYFGDDSEKEEFFNQINHRRQAVPITPNKFLTFKRLDSDNGIPEYLVSVEYY